MKVKLPIFHNTPESKELEKLDLGIDIKLSELPTKEVIFYNIAAIGVYQDEDITGTLIHIGSEDSFICKLQIHEVEKLIDESLNNK